MIPKPEPRNNKEIAPHILSGSTTMIGVCVTIIALFRGLKVSMQTYADEFLSVDNFIFIAAALLAYRAMKTGSTRMEWWADRLFFTGMLIMMIVGVIVVFSTY